MSKDLFEHYEELPPEVLAIVQKFGEEDSETDLYQQCRNLEEALNPLGYEFEWGLDGQPFNLKCNRIKVDNLTLDISQSDLRDIICAGYEGGASGIGYWFCSIAAVREEFESSDVAQYTSITGVDSDLAQDSSGNTLEELQKEEHGGMWTITPETIQKGIEVLFSQMLFGDVEKALLKNDIGMIDANDADCLIQLGLFGKVIYC